MNCTVAILFWFCQQVYAERSKELLSVTEVQNRGEEGVSDVSTISVQQ